MVHLLRAGLWAGAAGLLMTSALTGTPSADAASARVARAASDYPDLVDTTITDPRGDGPTGFDLRDARVQVDPGLGAARLRGDLLGKRSGAALLVVGLGRRTGSGACVASVELVGATHSTELVVRRPGTGTRPTRTRLSYTSTSIDAEAGSTLLRGLRPDCVTTVVRTGAGALRDRANTVGAHLGPVPDVTPEVVYDRRYDADQGVEGWPLQVAIGDAATPVAVRVRAYDPGDCTDTGCYSDPRDIAIRLRDARIELQPGPGLDVSTGTIPLGAVPPGSGRLDGGRSVSLLVRATNDGDHDLAVTLDGGNATAPTTLHLTVTATSPPAATGDLTGVALDGRTVYDGSEGTTVRQGAQV